MYTIGGGARAWAGWARAYTQYFGWVGHDALGPTNACTFVNSQENM